MDFILPFAVEPWHWLAAGAVLMALEVLLPGTMLMWFGLAAMLTGGLAYLFPVGVAGQFLAFGAFALAAIFPVRRLVARLARDDAKNSNRLNRLGADMVGRRVAITEAVINGAGAARFGDTRWAVRCDQDIQEGSPAVIVRVDGATLFVRPAE